MKLNIFKREPKFKVKVCCPFVDIKLLIEFIEKVRKLFKDADLEVIIQR